MAAFGWFTQAAGQVSGLVEASRILAETPGIVQVRFSHEDVVRHELVARIVKAYDDDSRDRLAASRGEKA